MSTAKTVTIKRFDVDMEVKNKGVEFQIHIGQKHRGNVHITKSEITWCKGKKRKENGVTLSWEEFAKMMENRD